MLLTGFNLFEECDNTKSATLIIRGGAAQFVDEAERSIHDSFMIVKSATKNTSIVGGGGAVEMELSRFLREYSRTVSGKVLLIQKNHISLIIFF